MVLGDGKGTTNGISKILKKHNLDTVSTMEKRSDDYLRNYKNRIPLEDPTI